MKQKLLLTFLLSSFLNFAQAPINQFVNSTETDYAIIDSTNPIDESVTGAAVTWNFTSLTQVGTNTDTNAAPTSGELSEYPNTTEVLTITTAGAPPVESKLFIRDNAGEISITGAAQGGQLALELSNNATLGTFPLSFNYSNSDTVSGNFSGDANGQAVNGTFTGDFDTSVDAHGTLNLNDFGLGAYNGNVTRLKTVLDINLVIFGFVNIGTVTQTSYNYYDDTDGNLVFRSSTNEVDIEIVAFGVDIEETIILYEAQDRSTLSTENNVLASNEIKLFPNPTNSVLNIKSYNTNTITSVIISDLNGRVVMILEDNLDSVDVSGLQSGLYITNIQTSNGNITKKFIKR